MAGELTTTSYAILGLLAVRPWTTYELAQQMDRAIGDFWPRTRSKLYEEPKKLVAHGLARARPGRVGNRPRTVYAITAKGRRALAAWLPTPSEAPQLEFEGLLKVFFAEHGSKADLLRTLDEVRRWTEEQTRSGAEICRGYLAGEGPFPERLPWLILCGQVLDDFVVAMADWADWATDVVQTWPEDIRQATPDLAALECMARRNEAYIRAADRRRGKVRERSAGAAND